MTDAKQLYAGVEFPERPSPDKVPELSELAFKYFYHLQKGSKIIDDAKAQSALNFLLNLPKNNDSIIETSLK